MFRHRPISPQLVRVASLYFKRPFAWHPEEKTLYALKLEDKYRWIEGFENKEMSVGGYQKRYKERHHIEAKKITVLADPGMKGEHADAWKDVPKRYILMAKDWETSVDKSLHRDVIERKLSGPAWICSKSDKLVCKFWPGEGHFSHRHIISTWKRLPTGELAPQHSKPHGSHQCIEIWQTMLRNCWKEFNPPWE